MKWLLQTTQVGRVGTAVKLGSSDLPSLTCLHQAQGVELSALAAVRTEVSVRAVSSGAAYLLRLGLTGPHCTMGKDPFFALPSSQA